MTRTATSFMYRLLRVVIVLFAVGHAPTWAATFNVNNQADLLDAAPGNGVCETAPGNGVCTLRAAVQESNALAGADTIVVPTGTYVTTRPGTAATGDSGGSFDLRDDLVIQGASAQTTVIDGGALDSVFLVNGIAKNVTLAELTVQNGTVSAARSGGGISAIRGNNLVLNRVVVRNNIAGEAAGIFNQGSLTLIESVIENNSTVSDGMLRRAGGILHASGTLVVRNSTVRNNTAAFGGGIVNLATAVIEASTINGNLATNSTSNGGDGGGGIANNGGATGGTLTISNSTVSGNQAHGHYGGLYVLSGSVVLSNTTLAANQADANADGFGHAGGFGVGNGAVMTIRNSIVAANMAAGPAKDCYSLSASGVTSGGHNLIGSRGIDTDCALAPATGDQVGSVENVIDPGLKPLANNGGPTLTHALSSNSAAVDAGNAAGCTDGANALALDQRGVPRALGAGGGVGRCDIGAYELAQPTVSAGGDQRVQGGATVVLQGSGNSVWSEIVSEAWEQVGGVPVALLSADSATASFTAPLAAGVLTFRFTVTDGFGGSASDTVAVTVNAVPFADAGTDQSVDAGAVVTLNGSASRDPDGTVSGYAWTQVAGPGVTLANPDVVAPSFVAPASGGTLVFRLLVTDNDGAVSAPDEVTIAVAPPPQEPPPTETNKAPIADAGPDETVRPRSLVVLTGWHSRDSDGRIVKYHWVQTSGAPVRLFGPPRWPVAMFVAPRVEGTLTFQLIVTDNKGATGTDTVTVTVDDCAPRWYDWFWRTHKRACR